MYPTSSIARRSLARIGWHDSHVCWNELSTIWRKNWDLTFLQLGTITYYGFSLTELHSTLNLWEYWSCAFFVCVCVVQSEQKAAGEKPAIYQLKLSSKNSFEDFVAYLIQKGTHLYLHVLVSFLFVQLGSVRLTLFCSEHLASHLTVLWLCTKR